MLNCLYMCVYVCVFRARAHLCKALLFFKRFLLLYFFLTGCKFCPFSPSWHALKRLKFGSHMWNCYCYSETEVWPRMWLRSCHMSSKMFLRGCPRGIANRFLNFQSILKWRRFESMCLIKETASWFYRQKAVNNLDDMDTHYLLGVSD